VGQARRTAELRNNSPARDRDGVLSGRPSRPNPWGTSHLNPRRSDGTLILARTGSAQGSRATAPPLGGRLIGAGEVRSREGRG
jgi:hypothetical protein